jgi:hypothetical protein
MFTNPRTAAGQLVQSMPGNAILASPGNGGGLLSIGAGSYPVSTDSPPFVSSSPTMTLGVATGWSPSFNNRAST